MLIISPDMKARGQVAGWENDVVAEKRLSPEDRELIITFMVKIFALEDLENYQPEAVGDQPLFSEAELQQISEIIESYPAVAVSIQTFFFKYLNPMAEPPTGENE